MKRVLIYLVTGAACLLGAASGHAQGPENVIVNRYSDVHDGRVFTEFGRLHYTGVFEATNSFYNPTSICTVDTLQAVTARTVIDQASWDTNAAFYSQSFYITGIVYEVEGNPRYIVHSIDDRLSPTTFAVNGSSSPSGNLADTVLRFAAGQTATVTGLSVRVQATTTPNTESSWTDLNNGRGGRMTYSVADKFFVLNSTDYPLQNGVYFRAISSAFGYPDSISAVIPPTNQPGLNLTSSKPHLPPTKLFVATNTTIADLYYRATVTTVQAGVSLRVQVSTAPRTEGSWTDLNDGNAGHMTQSTIPNEFLLLVNNYPAGQGLYFRAIASLSGSVDSISQPVGAFNLISDVPPKVTMTPPSPALAGGGDGSSPDKPILLQTGFFGFGASVQSGQPLKYLGLGIDGTILTSFQNGETSGSTITANVIGDHVLEAIAVDQLGGTRRSDAGLLYIRIVPSSSASKSTRAETDTAAAASSRTFHVVTNNGVWTDPTTWKDENGQNGVPGPDDFAIIGSATVRFGLDGDAKSVSINGGHLVGGASLNIYGQATIFAASVDGPMTLLIKQDAICELLNAQNIQFNPDSSGFRGNIINRGTCNVHGAAGIVGTQQFVNLGTLNWQRPLTPPLNAATDPLAGVRMIAAQQVSNSGLITGSVASLITSDGAGLITSDGAGILTNNGGTVISNDGGSIISHDGGTVIGDDGSGLVSDNGLGLLNERGNGLISSDSASLLSDGGAGFHPVAPGATTGQEATAAGTGFVQSAGEIDISHTIILGPATINGGSVTGSGIIAGDVTNNSFVTPGHSVGGITILGNYTQGAQGTLVLENGGFAPDKHDRFQVNGVASLNGRLDLRDINGYVQDPADKFNPIGFHSVSGSFSSVSSNAQITLTSRGALVSVNPNVPGPKAGQPLNIATRLAIQSGDNVLIAGFIVNGPSGSTKKVVIRGIGPSLASFGVAGTISDPLLELHKPDGSVVVNDNWQQGDTSQIPSGFAPSDPRESVIVATLSPGNYSAVVKGAHGETGVCLAEVYDFSPDSAAQLANIATRGFVNTGDGALIGGFIVGGSEPAKMLVIAAGPSLAAFGVNGALPDPTLELHDSNGNVISNDDWRNTQEAEITASGLIPADNRESAILATLVPGNYTAVVRGKNNTTGIAIVQAFNLQ